MTLESMLNDTLEARREAKRKVLASGDIKLPTDDERRAYQHQLYMQSGSMGSVNTPLYRG